MAVPPSMFPTWPAKSEKSRSQRKEKSPKPPEGGVNTFLVRSTHFYHFYYISMSPKSLGRGRETSCCFQTGFLNYLQRNQHNLYVL